MLILKKNVNLRESYELLFTLQKLPNRGISLILLKDELFSDRFRCISATRL
jgi:hypothetical protein